jgi:hypothetical protein
MSAVQRYYSSLVFVQKKKYHRELYSPDSQPYRRLIRSLLILCVAAPLSAVLTLPALAQPVGAWMEQPIEVPVRSLMGISMADTGTGYAVGDVDVIAVQTGILLKKPGDPTWRTVPAGAFTPPLTIALTSWAQDVHAIPNTSTAFISWRDDYRSLVYKTTDGGASWFSVSPLNPILYGIRYAINFVNAQEGMIVGEGPGRVHRTIDGGVTWKSYTIPVNPPLTDVKHSGTYWVVAGGENSLFRFNPVTQRWFDLSFTHSTEFFPTHIKIHFINDDYGYLYGFNANSPAHMLKTTNAGRDWTPVQSQPPFASNPDGHKGICFFDTLKGWVSSGADEFAYTADGGYSWTKYLPQVFGGKPYPPVNKMVFLNEAFGWAVGGMQRGPGYPSVSHGWIMKWTGTQKPDISTTPTAAAFDTMACQTSKDIRIPVYNTGSGSLTIASGGITFNSSVFSLRNVTWPIIIPPGGMVELEVRWEPGPDEYGLTPTGSQMSIISNDAEHTPWNILLYGNRLISRLLPMGSALVFPPVCRGERSEAAFKVDVFGNLAPTITKVEIFSDRGTLELLSHTIGNQITGPDSLRFAISSDKAGVITGNVLVTAGDPNCPQLMTIPFTGLIQSNSMELTPALVQFKDVCVGEEIVQYVQLKNIGTVPGRIREFAQYGGDSVFTLVVDTALNVDDGQFVQLALRYHPRRADSLNTVAQFRLVFAPCADTVVLACSGRGVEAFMEFDADSILVVGPAPLDRAITTVVPLRNTGFLQTELEDVWFDPPVPGLQLTAPTALPLSIRQKSSLDAVFTYQASSKDSIWTTLHARWSDPCGGSITQRVLLISDEMPIIEVQDALVFATQTCEAEVLDSVPVHNTGQKPLVIFTAAIEGSGAGHFRVVGPILPMTIDPGESGWIYLAYNAPANGGSSASLVLGHNDLTARGQSKVQLSGRKKVQTLTVVGDTLMQLQLCRDELASRRFVLRNDNNEVLLLSSADLMQGSPFATLRSNTIPTSVPPGGTFDLWVDVTLPLDTTITIEVRVITDPCRAVYTLRFRAGVPVPLLTSIPDPLTLGALPVTDTSTVAVRLRNSDTIDVVVDSLILQGVTQSLYLVQQLAAPRTLRPGESLAADLKVRLAKDTGAVSGVLCAVLSSPCPDTICFDIGVRFIGTPFVASVDTVRFTFASCDSVLCDSVRIVNALTVPQLLLPAVSNNAVFSVDPDTAVMLEAGEGATFRICARKPVPILARGELLLQSATGPLSAVALVAVREDAMPAVPDTVDAGNIPVCESERVFPIPIGNPNALAEHLLELRSSDGTFIPETSLPRTIAAHASDTLRIRFRPAGPGVYAATLSIRSRSGNCERTTVVQLTGRAGEEYITATPSTLLFANVVAGTAQSKTINILNRDMEGLRLASIALQPAAQFTTAATLPMDLAPGSSTDLAVIFQAEAPGNYFGSLCLIFDRPCADTVCVALEGIAIEGDLVFAPSQLRFDSLAYCQEEIDTVLLRNTGGTAVLLRDATINGPGAAGYTLLNPPAQDEPLPAGGSRPCFLRFRAADVPDGSATASLFISTDAPDQSVLELPLSGMRARLEVPPDVVINLGPLLLGSPVSIDTAVINTGDATLLLGGIQLHADYSYQGPVFPYALPGRQRSPLSLRFLPSREGQLDDTIRIPLGPCGGEFRLIVRGAVLRQFVQNHLDFGDVPICEIRSGLVTLFNNGTTPITLRSVQPTGSRAAAFRIENPPPLPYGLDPGAQLNLTISFTPLPGATGPYNVQLVTEVLLDGQPVVFQSDLSAMVRDGGLTFTDTTFLGDGQLGTEYTGNLLVGRNTTTFTVRIEEIILASPQLRLLSASPAAPVDIAPGDSMIIALAYIPDRLGRAGDSIHIRYGAPCETTLNVPVSYEGYGDLLPLTLRAGMVSGAPDDTVDIPLLLSRDITGLNIREWRAGLRFNASMLYPVAVSARGMLSEGMQLTYDYDRTEGAVTVTASGGRLAGSGDMLAVLRCLVLIGNDSVTALQPEAASFAHPAVLVERHEPGRFNLDGYCLADGRRLLGQTAALQLAPPLPNPAHATVYLRYVLPVDGAYALLLFDAQGRLAATIEEGSAAAGPRETLVNCAHLPAGTYVIMLRSSGGSVTEKLTVVR